MKALTVALILVFTHGDSGDVVHYMNSMEQGIAYESVEDCTQDVGRLVQEYSKDGYTFNGAVCFDTVGE